MPVIYMDRASIESLTEKDIREIIDENSTDVKYGMLHDYYVGNHRILGENKKDSTAPNNRLVNNMAKYITDTATGYFVGEPIVYDSQNDEYLQTVQDIFDYNDEQDHNMELAKQCSICGSCFEMLYLDEDAKIRLGSNRGYSGNDCSNSGGRRCCNGRSCTGAEHWWRGNIVQGECQCC